MKSNLLSVQSEFVEFFNKLLSNEQQVSQKNQCLLGIFILLVIKKFNLTLMCLLIKWYKMTLEIKRKEEMKNEERQSILYHSV
jgi:uncharacterized membrane protein YidH (DUF202 family)